MRLKNIIKTMKKDKYPAVAINQFEHILETYGYDETLFEFVGKMDKLLTEKQRFSIWERNGGCRLGGRNREAVAFQLEHGDKALIEKLRLLKKVPSLNRFRQNQDGTSTAGNGCHLCVLKKPKPPYTPPTLFGCSAGGALYNYEIALGVKLKMKSIDFHLTEDFSQTPYSFTFEVS